MDLGRVLGIVAALTIVGCGKPSSPSLSRQRTPSELIGAIKPYISKSYQQNEQWPQSRYDIGYSTNARQLADSIDELILVKETPGRADYRLVIGRRSYPFSVPKPSKPKHSENVEGADTGSG